MVTGMGFCLPGGGSPVCTAKDLWAVASRGQSRLVSDGIYHAAVRLSQAEFAERVPGIAGTFTRHFTAAHRFGLVALAAAAQDAGLDYEDHRGGLREAAILAGRGSVDANISSYLTALQADPETVTAAEAMDLYVGTELAASPSDVASVQAALTRSEGPCYTVSCGCASSAVQVGNAFSLIAAGAVDVAVVTGVDVFNEALVRKAQRMLRLAQHAAPAGDSAAQRLLPSFDEPMRPYDRRAKCVNFGEGAAALILESREHADRRGARCYGRILSHAMARDGLPHPLASDESGAGLVKAARRCLGGRWDVSQIPYVHGGSDGDVTVTAFEVNTIRELYGPAARPLMSSQEACFGHNGAPAGSLGVALTLLMIQHGEICPSANCEQPAEGLPFDPVPGTRTRPLKFSHALNFTYQIGGVKSAILVGAAGAE